MVTVCLGTDVSIFFTPFTKRMFPLYLLLTVGTVHLWCGGYPEGVGGLCLLITFARTDDNVCNPGCKRLREKRQCTARTDAVHCGSGCSALRGRLQCTASEMAKTGTEIVSPILGKRKGRKGSPYEGHYSPRKLLPNLQPLSAAMSPGEKYRDETRFLLRASSR